MRRGKNFLPSFILTIFFWIAAGYIILKVPPTSITICYLLIALFFSLFLTLSLLFGNSRLGCLFSTGATVFLLLRYLKLANFLTILLLISSLAALEIYFRK